MQNFALARRKGSILGPSRPGEELHAVEWDDTKQSWERDIDWDGYELWKTVPTGWLQCGSQLKDFTFFSRLSQAVALFKVAQGFPHRDAKLCQLFTVGANHGGWFTDFMPNTWSESKGSGKGKSKAD